MSISNISTAAVVCQSLQFTGSQEVGGGEISSGEISSRTDLPKTESKKTQDESSLANLEKLARDRYVQWLAQNPDASWASDFKKNTSLGPLLVPGISVAI